VAQDYQNFEEASICSPPLSPSLSDLPDMFSNPVQKSLSSRRLEIDEALAKKRPGRSKVLLILIDPTSPTFFLDTGPRTAL
jgi:hypothetical protein